MTSNVSKISVTFFFSEHKTMHPPVRLFQISVLFHLAASKSFEMAGI